MEQSTHEVVYRDEKVVVGSDRSFGVVMPIALGAITLLNTWHSGRLCHGPADWPRCFWWRDCCGPRPQSVSI
jgi:hypothetical protein